MAVLAFAMFGLPARALGVGDVARDFVMHDQYDKSFRLSDYRGHVVVLLYAHKNGAAGHKAADLAPSRLNRTASELVLASELLPFTGFPSRFLH